MKKVYVLIVLLLASCTAAPNPAPNVEAVTGATDTASAAEPVSVDSASAETGIVADWLTYQNDFFGYQFSYPAEATITVQGVTGFPTGELPQGITADDYLQQLEASYPDDLCVGVQHQQGFVTFLPPWEKAGKYTDPCGVTGVGDYDLVEASETIEIDGRVYTATGLKTYERNQEARWVNEFYTITLSDGSMIHYGSLEGTEADFQETKEVLRQIVASFHSEGTSGTASAP